MIVTKLIPNWWLNSSRKKKLLTMFQALMIGVIVFNAQTIVYNGYYITYGWKYNPNLKLSMMINSVIGVPYSKQPEYRNDSDDFKRVSKEEWLGLPYFNNLIQIDKVEDELNVIENMPTAGEVEHITALLTNTPSLATKKSSKAILGKLCGGLFFCDAISVVVPSYGLKNPKILAGIVQIAKRPCDYIRTLNEVKPGDEVVFKYDFTYGLFGFVNFQTAKFEPKEIQERINAAKAVFTCDNKSFWEGGGLKSLPIFKRKFVLIMVKDEGVAGNIEDKSLDIIVAREDI